MMEKQLSCAQSMCAMSEEHGARWFGIGNSLTHSSFLVSSPFCIVVNVQMGVIFFYNLFFIL